MPHRTAITSLAVAAALLAVALAPPPPASPAQAAARATSTGPAPTPRGTQIAWPCVVTATRRVEPTMLRLGGTLDVTMTVQTFCRPSIFPIHVALVIEGSDAMVGSLGHDVKADATTLVDTLDLPDNASTRVTVIGFDDRVRVRCPLTGDAVRVKRCIERIGAQGGARLDVGLAEAGRQLWAARDDYAEPKPIPGQIREVIVVYATHSAGGCARPAREAARLKGRGILLISVCAGRECDVACLTSIATSPRYAFDWRSGMQLVRLFETIRKSFQSILLKRQVITDRLPAALQILSNTVSPEPSDIDVGEGRVRWIQTHMPREGVTVTFRARAVALGLWPSTLGATFAFTDNRNRIGFTPFPSVPITVLGSEPGLSR